MPRGQTGGALFGYGNNIYGTGYNTYTTDTGVTTGFLQYFWYAIVLVVVAVFMLVLVHYLIKPIFILKPGDKGIIPLPGSDDAGVFWKSTKDVKILKDVETPLAKIVENWSMALDIQLDNPTANTTYPRVLFTRGEAMPKPKGAFTEEDTILKINPNFNVCIWLDRMTNDLNVSLQTSSSAAADSQPLVETIQVPNIPIGKTVRIGVMVGSRVLEVYVNGYLIKSKTFLKPVRTVTGEIQPPLEAILSTTARVANLRLWGRPLTPGEFRGLGLPTDIGLLKELPDSCAT